MTMRRLLLMMVVLVLAAACGDDDAPVAAGGDDGGGGSDAPQPTDGEPAGEYRSVEVTEGGAPRALVDGTTISLRLDDGRLGADAGCNQMGGPYRIDAGVLVVDDLSMTEMGCDQPRHDQDQWLAGLLAARPTVETTDDGFVLRSEGGDDVTEVRFVERSVVEPDAELVGTTWEVTGFLDGDVAMSGAAGVEPGRLGFEANGFVGGFDGCNGFGHERGGPDAHGLRYVVDGDRIRYEGAPISTMKACEDKAVQDHQRRFHRVLSESVSWSIEGDSLTLVTDDGAGVTYRAVDD